MLYFFKATFEIINNLPVLKINLTARLHNSTFITFLGMSFLVSLSCAGSGSTWRKAMEESSRAEAVCQL